MTEDASGARQSIWRAIEMPKFERLAGDAEADVCVIGGGITGLTAALLLAREGREVVLIERRRLGAGVTGSTTAHLTALVDADYGALAKELGLAAVRGVYTSMAASVDRIAELVNELGADCDFERMDAHYYAELGGDAKSIRASFEALRAAGLEVGRIEEGNALPFPTSTTLVVENQAAFHPMRYLAVLARAASESGVRIHEETSAREVRDGKPCTVDVGGGKTIRAAHLFHATHSPPGINLVQSEMTQCRSYVIAARVAEKIPPGLFFDDAQPYRYIRRHVLDGSELALIGGADHKTGKGDPVEAMRGLERYARDRFEVTEIVARWSAQVYQAADGLPFIGWAPLASRSIIATGYAGDGMTFGTLAAMIGADLVAGRKNAWAELYKPSRFHPRASATTFLSTNLEVAKSLVVDRLKGGDAKALEEVLPGEGRVMRLEGRKLAVYRDDSGVLHAHSAVCPHLKCIVHWNAFERSWDCPCHGSRFDATGAVVEGPSMHDLPEVEAEKSAARDAAE